MLKILKRIDYRHLIAVAILLGSVALEIFVYRYPLLRLIESGEAFGRSIAQTFLDMLGLAEDYSIRQTVNEFSRVDLSSAIGINIDELRNKLTDVWSQLFVGEHFRAYLLFLLWYFVRGLYWIDIVLILCLPVICYFIFTWDVQNTDHGKETRTLRFYKRYVLTALRYVADWCRDFWDFFQNSGYWTIFLIIWAVNSGLLSLMLSFLAYYFYILTVTSFATLDVQLLKLVADLLLTLNTLPWYCWAALFAWLFDRWRLAHAADKMQHLEAQNKGMLNEMPMCSFSTAPPRTGKTTLNTDMALSYAAIFRHKALQLMTGNVNKFPRFPWILFELDLKKQIKEHHVYNLATARHWVNECYEKFCEEPEKENLWNYDYEEYPTSYNDQLTVLPIWEVLSNYAQEFFIYFLESSLIISNYAIREDFIILDEGNFPLIDCDFFGRDPEELDEISTHSHVIDFDMLRLGQKMTKDNPHIGALEFGVILVSEIDKERKNDLRLRELKPKEGECTQKNDLFNEWMKMAGQSAMVENYCFLRIISDAQRPSSWGADARELSTVLHLEKQTETENALPFYWFEDWLINKYRGWWENIYLQKRFERGDTRLITWLGQGLNSILYSYQLRRGNRFGYYRQNILTESGTLEKEHVEERRYTVAKKKIFAARFATDHFKSYSQIQTANCEAGLNDLPCYNSIYPTFEEMIIQNSHFCKELMQYFDIITKEEE